MKQKITIITVNLNNLEGLKKTLDSVFSQSWKGFEYIIIDGASTDGSVEYIKKNEDKIDLWISEPDNGVYHAMNKGIKKATGEYILFLNSGDHFYNRKVLEQNVKFIKGYDLIYFNLQVVRGNKNYIKKYPDTLSFSYFVKDTLPHPATFIKREAFERTNYFNEDFKIVSDWKFFIDSVCKYNLSYKKIDTIFSTFYLGGMSSNPKNRTVKYNEIRQVLKSDYPAYVKDIDGILLNNEILISLRKSRIIKLLVKLGFLNKF